MTYNTARPYTASYVIVRKNDKMAFVLRTNTNWMNGHYGLPAGKVEHDETFIQAAIREAKEEIGITVTSADLRHILTMHRMEENETNCWADVFFEATDWQGDVYNAEPHMHSEVAWLNSADLPDNTIPAIKFALEQIKAGRSYCEYGWN